MDGWGITNKGNATEDDKDENVSGGFLVVQREMYEAKP